MQDLVNTVDLEGGPDELTTPEQLTAWVRERGLTSIGVLGGEGAGAPGAQGRALTFDAKALSDVLALREALRDVCSAHAGADVPLDTLVTLELLLAAAPLHLAVDAEGGASVVPAPGLTGARALTAHVAAAVAAATADGTWQRLKACASDTCRWAYYDRSPAGRGRWCSMAICGSRAKMRTYRAMGRPTA